MNNAGDTKVILGNPTPELMHLRAALRIDWDPYRAWIDHNLERVNRLADETEADGEQAAPAIRALFVFESWCVGQVAEPERRQIARDIAKAQAGVNWVKAVLVATLALSAIGCTTLRTPTQTSDSFPSAALEGVYQVANGLDNATTINLARRPDCYREVGFPTAEALGHHPSPQSVEAYWVVESALHFTVSHWLDREVDATDNNGWRAARIVWHVVTIAGATRGAVDNYRIGLRPFGAGASSECRETP